MQLCSGVAEEEEDTDSVFAVEKSDVIKKPVNVQEDDNKQLESQPENDKNRVEEGLQRMRKGYEIELENMDRDLQYQQSSQYHTGPAVRYLGSFLRGIFSR
jgi:hypothetical protein